MKPILERQTVREILELSQNPTLEEVKANYKRLVKQFHPDVNKTPEAAEYMKRINRAYAIATGKEKVKQTVPPPPQQQTVVTHFTYRYWTSGSSSSGSSWM